MTKVKEWFWRGSVLLCVACAHAAPPSPPLPQTTFSFVPPEACKGAGGTKVAFAIVAPLWTSSIPTLSTSDGSMPLQALYDDFSKSMKNDFLAMTTCKGFSSRGPFNSYDEMVFPERIGSDLVLVPELNVKVAVQSTSESVPLTVGNFFSALFGQSKNSDIILKGTATISGRVTLAIKESVTNTRMWTRNIEVAQEQIEFIGERRYAFGTPQSTLNQYALGDNGLARVLAPKLQAIYGRVLLASWNNLDTREMELVKKQSLEPRAKAGIVITK